MEQPKAANIVRESAGVYSVPYTLPMGHVTIVHEWTGLDGQGHPIRAAVDIDGIAWSR